MPDFREDKQLLYSIFGLCPDYQIVFTEEDYCEVYEPRTTKEKYRYMNALSLEEIIYPDAYRLHLDKHSVELHDGSIVTANFAVSHATKMIFLKISRNSEFGRITKYE